MTDPNQPQSSDPPPYQVPPPYDPPEPTKRGGLPGWAWVLIIGGGAGTLLLCIIIPLVVIGGLTLLGQRVSTVFSEIDTGLEDFPTPVPVDTTGALPVGTTATLTNLHITITDAQTTSAVSGLMDPLSGHEYWLVEATFENVAADQEAWIDPFSSWVQDPNGMFYEYYWEAAEIDEVFAQYDPLQPGSTMSGTLIYEVEQNREGLFWIYEDFDSGEQAVFQLE